MIRPNIPIHPPNKPMPAIASRAVGYRDPAVDLRFQKTLEALRLDFNIVGQDDTNHHARGVFIDSGGGGHMATVSFDPATSLLQVAVDRPHGRVRTLEDMICVARLQQSAKVTRVNVDPDTGRLKIVASSVLCGHCCPKSLVRRVVEDLWEVLADHRLAILDTE
jgi:hypothetical protein